MSEKARRSFKQ